jgi:hypothetical protein
MKSNSLYILALSSVVFMGACVTSQQTALQTDQNDDVYYSEARAREQAEVIAQVQPEQSSKSDYVTDEELYGDGEYAQRINRFRNYAPWRGYYNNIYDDYYLSPYYGSMYGGIYDPFYSPYSFYGPGINLAVGINGGFYNYNPWRYYGYNYSGRFMGPYSYYNPYGFGFGGGYYGYNGLYGGGYGVGRPVYTSPNYRPRPGRGSEMPADSRGVVGGGAIGGVNGNGNGNIRDNSRAGRYNGGTPGTSGTRPQATSPRPERVSQQPQRTSQPERIYSAPPSNNTGGGRSSGGGNSGGGGRPSRGN